MVSDRILNLNHFSFFLTFALFYFPAFTTSCLISVFPFSFRTLDSPPPPPWNPPPAVFIIFSDGWISRGRGGGSGGGEGGEGDGWNELILII